MATEPLIAAAATAIVRSVGEDRERIGRVERMATGDEPERRSLTRRPTRRKAGRGASRQVWSDRRMASGSIEARLSLVSSPCGSFSETLVGAAGAWKIHHVATRPMRL